MRHSVPLLQVLIQEPEALSRVQDCQRQYMAMQTIHCPSTTATGRRYHGTCNAGCTKKSHQRTCTRFTHGRHESALTAFLVWDAASNAVLVSEVCLQQCTY